MQIILWLYMILHSSFIAEFLIPWQCESKQIILPYKMQEMLNHIENEINSVFNNCFLYCFYQWILFALIIKNKWITYFFYMHFLSRQTYSLRKIIIGLILQISFCRISPEKIICVNFLKFLRNITSKNSHSV